MHGVKTSSKRLFRRSPIFKVSEYSVITSSDNKMSYGIISDISESGMCLMTADPLKPGEQIVIKSNPLSRTAIVRWNNTGDSYFKAGLQFL